MLSSDEWSDYSDEDINSNDENEEDVQPIEELVFFDDDANNMIEDIENNNNNNIESSIVAEEEAEVVVKSEPDKEQDFSITSREPSINETAKDQRYHNNLSKFMSYREKKSTLLSKASFYKQTIIEY